MKTTTMTTRRSPRPTRVNLERVGTWRWCARETRRGWKLWFDIGARSFPVTGLLLDSEKDVLEVVGDDRATVIVPLEKSKRRKEIVTCR